MRLGREKTGPIKVYLNTFTTWAPPPPSSSAVVSGGSIVVCCRHDECRGM